VISPSPLPFPPDFPSSALPLSRSRNFHGVEKCFNNETRAAALAARDKSRMRRG